MAGGALGGVDNDFAYKMIVFALVITILFPTFLTVYVSQESDGNEVYDEALEQYYLFTGNNAATNENVWVLTGIYTPYTGDTYGYTDDGWLYGSRIQSYTPSQYQGLKGQYTVELTDGVYRYSSFLNSTTTVDDEGNETVTAQYGGYEVGELYSAVTMDVSQQSNVFFTTSGKTTNDDGFFYYEYSGYRYAFQPVADYTGVDSSGNEKAITSSTTSLSLIWYNYYGSSGVSGQLVLSGSDSGVAYITADQIVTAFDSSISTAKFDMVFNGVSMNVYIRIDPYMLNEYTIEECYNNGYWSIMVTSLTTDASSYTSTANSFSVAAIFDTIIDLFTFNAEDLGLEGMTATLASLVVVIPLYAALLSIGMSFYPVLILAGILAAIQGLLAIF